MPTMRAATAPKKSPKSRISTAPGHATGTPGSTTSATSSAATMPIAAFRFRSRSVRPAPAPPGPFIPLNAPVMAAAMPGSDFTRLNTPPAATMPAPT